MSYFRIVIEFVLEICLIFLIVDDVILDCALKKSWFLTDKSNCSPVVKKIIFFNILPINQNLSTFYVIKPQQ